jgi:hypothetical protein
MLAAYAGVYALALLQLGLYWGRLPERLATHFGSGGQPNGWSPKEGVLLLHAVLLLVLTLPPLAIGRKIPTLPADKINLPNKAYWLAPERRAETFASLSRALGLLGCGLGLSVTAAMHFVFEANLAAQPALDETGFTIYLAAAALVPIAFVLWTFTRFKAPAQ